MKKAELFKELMRYAIITTALFTFVLNSVSAESSEETDEIYNFEEINLNQNNALFATFNYGTAASWLTRITKQTGRSNFVLRDFLPGLYFTTEFQNVPNITPAVRIAAYYPLISSFNHVPQLQNTPLHFAVDLFTGVKIEFDFNLFRLTVGPGLHMFFMTSDRWYYLNGGIAASAGFELAMSSGWTLMIDGFASLDYGNFGSNSEMEPFDIVYQYQAAIGVRYSKKNQNDTVLFPAKAKTPKNKTKIDEEPADTVPSEENPIVILER